MRQAVLRDPHRNREYHGRAEAEQHPFQPAGIHASPLSEDGRDVQYDEQPKEDKAHEQSGTSSGGWAAKNPRQQCQQDR
ncbi:hypothetical protein D3C78_1489330 [compost metagenome]